MSKRSPPVKGVFDVSSQSNGKPEAGDEAVFISIVVRLHAEFSLCCIES